MRKNSVLRLSTAALLIAVGIIIPMFSPVKILLEPASFTLASHVAIFIAMFISPAIAAAVTVGTTVGFFLAGFPIVVVLRAASHLVFAVLGAFYLQKAPQVCQSAVKLRVFSFVMGLIHALCEVLVVSVFYFGGDMVAMYYQQGFYQSVLLLVGLGTVVHSMVDFEIANLVVVVLRKQSVFQQLLHKA